MDDIGLLCERDTFSETIEHEIISVVSDSVYLQVLGYSLILCYVWSESARQNHHIVPLLEESGYDVFKEYLYTSKVRLVEVEDKEDFHDEGNYYFVATTKLFIPSWK